MTRWRQPALVVGACCYAVALPPFDVAAAAWVALVPLIAVARTAHPAAAARAGAAAGFYAAWAVTWWLPQAIAAYFDAGLPMGIATISLAYLLAVSSTFAAFAWGVARLRTHTPGVRLLTIAALWVTVELLRARLLDDPWALLGYTQYRALGLIQIAEGTGVFGVSFLVALGNAALAETVLASAGDRTRPWRAAGLAACAIALVWALGAASLGREPALGTPVRVAVVQPNVAPAHTWTRGYAERQLAVSLRLTRPIEPGSVDLVVWPENAIGLYPERDPMLRRLLESTARVGGYDLLFGAPRHDGHGTFNSARLVSRAGRWAHYDKQRLVPFAEAPLGSPRPPTTIDASPRAFSAGSGPGVLASRWPIGVSICHELLYPDVVSPSVAAGAAILVNLANDGWLDGGYGVASRQHFAMGVFRAVETRRYLVRAATTGISGVVAPSGRIVRAADVGTAEVLTADVEPRRALTLYVRWGDWFAATCAVVVLATLLPIARPRRRAVVATVPRPA